MKTRNTRPYRLSYHRANQEVTITDRATGKTIAEYAAQASDARALRRAINKHLDAGGTLGNYQW